jgi:predicted nucleic acid-binding protein
MAKPRIIVDTDVVINWLCREVETSSQKILWKAPLTVAKNAETGTISGNISLLSILEVRFVLRRKKRFSRNEVEKDIQDIQQIYQSIVPDEIIVLRAHQLQSREELDPFDSLLLSTALSFPEIHLITRDSLFRSIAQSYVRTCTPEEFVEKFRLS